MTFRHKCRSFFNAIWRGVGRLHRGPDGRAIRRYSCATIFSLRFEENRGWGSCGGGVEALDPVTRHRLIAHWLRVSQREMPWQPIESFTIVWTNKAAYEGQLGKIIESERYKLNSSVESLRNRGFLREVEVAMPRLALAIECDITPCPLE